MNNKGENKLGNYLRALRQSLGYSQSFVASELNVLRQTYSHYETGRIIPPTQTMTALSKLYNVPVEDLMILSTVDDEREVTLPKRSKDLHAMPDMDEYIAYINTPINVSKLRFLGESEKRLLFYFSKLCHKDKHDLIEFLRIRTSHLDDDDYSD